jgi:hypothetical protein
MRELEWKILRGALYVVLFLTVVELLSDRYIVSNMRSHTIAIPCLILTIVGLAASARKRPL